MTNINTKRRLRNPGALLCLICAAALLTCKQVPDYCGKGQLCDPDRQFCFDSKTYDRCGGSSYNPLTNGCDTARNTVSARCLDGSVAKTGAPCGGYTVATRAIPADGGSIALVPNNQNYDADQYIFANAVPAANYTFVKWEGELTSLTSYAGFAINGAAAVNSLTAVFKPIDAPGAPARKLITAASPENGGIVTRSPNGGSDQQTGTYNAGTTVRVTAENKPGYTFIRWSGAYTAETQSVAITMNESNTLVALFKPSVCTLTVNANPTEGGAVFINNTAKAGTMRIDFGTTVEARAVAAAGYTFTGWSGGSTSADAALAITMNASKTLTANFKKSGATQTPAAYTVTVSSAGTGSTGGGNYTAGTTVSIFAGTAPSGYTFKNWTATGGVTPANPYSARTTFTMPANAVTVTANWEPVSGGGGSYEYVEIGGLKWMKKNLDIVTDSSWCYGEGGRVYDQNGNTKTLSSSEIQANCAKYGRLYTWSAAMTACPSGWHLPSREEWGALAKAAGGTGDYGADSSAGKKLKSTSGWYNNGNRTDDFGFSALPGGYRYSSGNFDNAGYGYWLTATESDGSNAYYRYMGYDNDYVGEHGTDKGHAFSVRCVQD
ncbi:hypothetical protein R80B4_03305 [Fibrobacteres bacterium R8-0-B4]